MHTVRGARRIRVTATVGKQLIGHSGVASTTPVRDSWSMPLGHDGVPGQHSKARNVVQVRAVGWLAGWQSKPPVSSRTDPTAATSRAGMARIPGSSVPMLLGADYWRLKEVK